jgi:Methyltransferase domain
LSCKICASPVAPLFRMRILGRHDIAYFRCAACGFVQTEEPYWLEEAYSSAMLDVDLGPINRALLGSATVETLILAFFDPNARYVDWGGGYGIFTRMMRDLGYDFYWKDLYCENLFAKQFEAESSARYELLTAFEVFEHLSDPIREIEQMLAFAPNIFFTTLLVPPGVPSDWWYFLPETGQHIALYTKEALAIIARRFGLHLNSDGMTNHLLSRKPVSPRLFRLMVRGGRTAGLARRILRRKAGKQSLLDEDFRAAGGLGC